jgi:hypothetical protein
VDLYDPGSGSQVHDFNGGITAAGLFWTLKIPSEDLVVSADGKTATLTVVDQPVIDSFEFLGQNSVPATVSFSITWTATGTARHLTPGSPEPTDPSNFAGDIYFRTVATGSFSGSEEGFRFRSDPGATSEGVFAEMGREGNGSFLS